MPGDFMIRIGYRARAEPRYFVDDETGIVYQPDVYTDAALVAERLGCSRIVDVGCGNATKLVRVASRFELVGIDFGSNIETCRNRHPVGTWIEHDLEEPGELPVDMTDAAVICADVIEHVIRPDLLLEKLLGGLTHASVLFISTPERDLVRGGGSVGPPRNQGHVREWTVREFACLLRRSGFEHVSMGLSRSNDRDNRWNTILAACVSKRETFATVEDALIDAPRPPDMSGAP
jgi:SAM-dependent methyltransferase